MQMPTREWTPHCCGPVTKHRPVLMGDAFSAVSETGGLLWKCQNGHRTNDQGVYTKDRSSAQSRTSLTCMCMTRQRTATKAPGARTTGPRDSRGTRRRRTTDRRIRALSRQTIDAVLPNSPVKRFLRRLSTASISSTPRTTLFG